MPVILHSSNYFHKKALIFQGFLFGGGGRNRTGVDGFAGRCITTLLPRHNRPNRRGADSKKSGAGNESRTRDLNLGKVALYQLSYSRVYCFCAAGAGNESRTRDLNLGKVALYQLSYSRVVLPLCCWSGKRVSNSRPQPWQGCALPTELFPHQCPQRPIFRPAATRRLGIIKFTVLLSTFIPLIINGAKLCGSHF